MSIDEYQLDPIYVTPAFHFNDVFFSLTIFKKRGCSLIP